MSELKPCPFCGGEAKESSPESNGSKYWRITCQSCYARIGGTHRGMNREAWNTRAEFDGIPMTEENMAAHGWAKVVRCRDCKHYADHEWITSPQYGLGTDIEHVCHFWHGEPTKVEPGGFCAWGKERTPNG